MLTQIRVDNFRCMSDFTCDHELGQRQLIVGPNGAGKSTFFEVLGLLRDFCVRGDPPLRFGGDSVSRWQRDGATAEQNFRLQVTGNGGTYTFRLTIDSWGTPARPRVVEEEVCFDGKPIFRFALGEVYLFNDLAIQKVQYPFDWHRSALATITERKDNTKLSWFKQWLGGLLYVQPNPWLMLGVAAQEAERPDQQLTNFAEWYRHLCQDTDVHEYLRDLGEVIEGFVGMRLEAAGEGRREIKVRMAVDPEDGKGSKRETEFLLSELSEGQRVLIGIYAVLHFAVKPGATLCFDEPDNFIALREVQPWLSKLLERAEEAEPPAQVLLASHHPELLNRMAFMDGISFERPMGLGTRARAFADPAQTGLTAAELVARGWEHE